MAGYIEYYAYMHGFKLMLCNSRLDPVKEKDYIEMLKRNRVDGIIMGTHTLEVSEYAASGAPIVAIERQLSPDIPFVSSDNYRGGELATGHLIAKGCRKIAHICGNLELKLHANLRSEAFKKLVLQHGVEHVIIQSDMNVFDQEQYARIIRDLFREHPDVDGVFATSDIIAAFVIKECERIGKRVPEDVRVVGFDDIKMTNWMTPAVTTIRQPIEAIGKLAIELLRKQMDEQSFERENILPVTLVERATT
jgi:LacI family sucrose operon transcriptional repressor